MDVPSFQPVEGTDSYILDKLADYDYLGNEVFNPKTAQLRSEAMAQLDSTPTEETMIELGDGSISHWDPAVYYKKDLSNVKMKLYDEDGLPIDGYDYRKHMVLSSCRRKQSAPWVNPNLFYQYNQKEIQEREEYSQAVSEHRSQLLNECRSNHQSEEKALQDFRWKTNGESELSFNQNDNGSCKSSNNGSKFS